MADIQTSQTQVNRPTLTVVMPAYNEEAALADAVAEIQTHILDRVAGSELMVVNDGSGDRTGALLDELATKDDRVRAIHQANTGHGGAVMRGLSEARGRYLFLIDSDRQIPLEPFERFWKEIQTGCDAVFGIRANRHDPKLRLILTRFIRGALSVLFGTRIRDANIPYKLLRRELWENARAVIPADTLAPSLFLAVFARLAKYDVREIEVPHVERSTGEVSIKRWKLFKFCAVAFTQLLAFRVRMRHVS